MRCKVLVAVSESTKRDLVELYGVPAGRVRVVPLGIERPGAAAPASRLAELGVDGKFVLQVGRIERRKNQVAALAAVEWLGGLQLVVAGPERDSQVAAKLRGSASAKGRAPGGTVARLIRDQLSRKIPAISFGNATAAG